MHPAQKILPWAITNARLLTARVGSACESDRLSQSRTAASSVKREPLLPQKLFASIVKHAPLIAIDLVIQNEFGDVLLGLRRNAPARGFWFVPGGRIFKGECIANAVDRVASDELAMDAQTHRASPLGVFEHFYKDNFTDAKAFGTHYIVLAYRLTVASARMHLLPLHQHAGYRWLPLRELDTARDVHPNSREYARHL